MSAIPAGNTGHSEARIGDMGGPPNTCIEHTDMRAPAREGSWAAAMGLLRQRIGEAALRAWFSEIDFVGFGEGLLTLSAPNKFTRAQVIERYHEAIIACWKKQNLHSSETVRVAIVVRSRHPTVGEKDLNVSGGESAGQA